MPTHLLATRFGVIVDEEKNQMKVEFLRRIEKKEAVIGLGNVGLLPNL